MYILGGYSQGGGASFQGGWVPRPTPPPPQMKHWSRQPDLLILIYYSLQQQKVKSVKLN